MTQAMSNTNATAAISNSERIVSDRIGKLKLGRQHSDYGEDGTAKRHRLVDDARVRTETALPQTVAENRDAMFAWRSFLRQKPATEQRLDAQQLEEVYRHRHTLHSLRLAGEHHIGIAAKVCRQRINLGRPRRGTITPISHSQNRNRVVDFE